MPATVVWVALVADQDRTAWLRQNLPTVASVVDDFAEVFGRDGFRVIYAKEGGHEFGKPGPDGVPLSETAVGPLAVKRSK